MKKKTKNIAGNAASAPARVSLPQESLRSELKRVTRERLVRAAFELFAKHGFRATTVQQIASSAGTTTPTFYRYFRSKDDFARLLQAHIYTEVLQTVNILDAIAKPTREAVRVWVRDYSKMWQRMHLLCDAYWEATITDAALSADILPATFRLTDSCVNMTRKLKGKAKEKFQTRLAVLLLLMDRLMYVVNLQKPGVDTANMVDEFAGMVWESLFEPHGADASAA